MNEEIKNIAALLKAEKQKAEGKIAPIVADFERTTGLTISHIRVNRWPRIDGKQTFVGVKIELGEE